MTYKYLDFLFIINLSHEMQHYMIAIQSYIYDQVIQVAWQELDKSLNEAHTLDNLVDAHANYLTSSLTK